MAPTVRESRGAAGTGHQTWHGASILSSFLVPPDKSLQTARMVTEDSVTNFCVAEGFLKKGSNILELGSGTGKLALDLARSGLLNITATDGDPGVVKNMKFNVQSNRLGHAVRCRCWDWAHDPPVGMDLSAFDLCIGSDLVYYNRPHAHLALALRRILTAKKDDLPPAKVLLLLTLRTIEDNGGRVVHHVSSEGYPGSSVQRFVEDELPAEGLEARSVTLLSAVFELPELREAFPTAEAQQAMVLYEVLVRKQNPVQIHHCSEIDT